MRLITHDFSLNKSLYDMKKQAYSKAIVTV